MFIKSLVIIAFLFIIFSLGSALFHLVKRNEQEASDKTVKALTVRISLSIILFIFIFIAFSTGLIKPSGIGARIAEQRQHQSSPTNP